MASSPFVYKSVSSPQSWSSSSATSTATTSPPALSTSQRQFAIHLQERTRLHIPSNSAENFLERQTQPRLVVVAMYMKKENITGMKREREKEREVSRSTIAESVWSNDSTAGWSSYVFARQRFTASWFFNQRRRTIVSFGWKTCLKIRKVGRCCRGNQRFRESSKLLIYNKVI